MSATVVQLSGQASGPDKPTPETTSPDRPEWLPEKFKSPEELAKAYAELETKQSTAPKQETTPEKPEGEKKDTPPVEQKPDQKQDTPPEQNKEFQPFFQEFAQKGELTEESYKALAAKGLSKDVVDSYIAGQKALQASAEAELLSGVGGKEGYAQLAEWARANLSQEDLNAYNKAIEGDLKQAKLAVDGLQARYESANGRAAATRIRGGNPAPTVSAFKSTAQLVAAMNDPRYKTDQAYRDEVEARLAISEI